jgi:uncharacterized protein (TIGR02145 family)
MNNFIRHERTLLFTAAALTVIGVLWSSGCSKKSERVSVPETRDTSFATSDTLPETTYNTTSVSVVTNDTLIDGRDGKWYRIVKIGNQTWMAENLNYWTGNSWCYNNDKSMCDKYGALYDWDLAIKVCPSGWHLPSRQEWCILVTTAGGDTAGARLKSKTGWDRRQEDCDGEDRYGNKYECPELIRGTDDFGFSALPGGYRYFADSTFSEAAYEGSWWTTSWYDEYAYFRRAYYDKNIVESVNVYKTFGFSVRCVMNDSGVGAAPIYTVTVLGAGTDASGHGCYIAGATVNITAGKAPKDQQFKNWSTENSSVTLADTNNAATTFIMPTGDVTVTAAFRNRKARGSAKLSGDTLTDVDDGQKYKTAVIGGKRWMAKNLNIALGNSWCYDDESSSCKKYGRLYDWNTARTACPAGWHLPTRQEWHDLAKATGGREAPYDRLDEISWHGAGKKLKAKRGWNDYNGTSGGGTDDYGFSALPGGLRRSDDVYLFAGEHGHWWTATEHRNGDVYDTRMSYEGNAGDTLYESHYNIKDDGFSVRCVQD